MRICFFSSYESVISSYLKVDPISKSDAHSAIKQKFTQVNYNISFGIEAAGEGGGFGSAEALLWNHYSLYHYKNLFIKYSKISIRENNSAITEVTSQRS